jgi:redox-sensing transcriptional repressor
MIKNLPPNTVERLSNYRRKLLSFPYKEKPFIHSHRLAHLLKINPAHVRRDLMLIGFTGDVHKGYDIENLIIEIGKAIDCQHKRKVAFIGIGDLGRATAETFNHEDSKLEIAATFRLTEEPTQQFPNVQCYNISKMKQIIRQKDIDLAVLALPNTDVDEITKLVVDAGVKGILNFTSAYLKVPEDVYVENYDMMSKLEKLSYFTNS